MFQSFTEDIIWKIIIVVIFILLLLGEFTGNSFLKFLIEDLNKIYR